MQRNIAVKLSFAGKNYHGFQRQKNAVTVQQAVEETLEKIIGSMPTVYGCSRTDTSVSAEEYVFNFHTDSKIGERKLFGALNHLLPPDIAALDCAEVPDDFHSRYCAVGKEYTYTIINAHGKNPFYEDRIYRYYTSHIDEMMLEKEACDFLGTHDFSAFCSAGSGVKSHIREVKSAKVERYGDKVVFTFSADGFLYNMVRIMVGTLLFINEGKIEKGSIPDIIESRQRKRAGQTAAACGLCLKKVFYENDPFSEMKGAGECPK